MRNPCWSGDEHEAVVEQVIEADLLQAAFQDSTHREAGWVLDLRRQGLVGFSQPYRIDVDWKAPKATFRRPALQKLQEVLQRDFLRYVEVPKLRESVSEGFLVVFWNVGRRL